MYRIILGFPCICDNFSTTFVMSVIETYFCRCGSKEARRIVFKYGIQKYRQCE
jgi:hypothetical protein